MKILHTADWHIGRKLNGFDLLEEQRHAFKQVVDIAQQEQVDAIVIAGDLYDRSVPATEAVEAFNQMMIALNLDKKIPVLAISGNHDSSTRLETGGPWFEHTQFHLHTSLEQAFEPIEMQDTQFFLLPYFEPFQARRYFHDESIKSLEEAMEKIVREMKKKVDSNKNQVLVAHFFAAGSQKSESETLLTVGGLEAVPVTLMEDFDYVALGHLHNKNALRHEKIKYSGTLLKYSLSEWKQEKGVRIVEINAHKVTQAFQKITPLKEVMCIEETFQTLMSPDFYKNICCENYIGISLKDQQIIPNVMAQLRSIYPNIIHLERAQGREVTKQKQRDIKELKSLDPAALFRHYFKDTTGETLTELQEKVVIEALLESQKKIGSEG